MPDWLPPDSSPKQFGQQAQDTLQDAAEKLGPLGQWLSNYGLEHLTNAVRTAIIIAIIIAVAIILRLLARIVIRRMVQRIVDAPMPKPLGLRKRGQRVVEAHQRIVEERRDQRAKTVGQVIGSVATIVIFGTAFILILGEIGVNLGPIIASAGIIGVAVAFGCQSLVSDFLSGIFMLMEDQYGVGDWIDAGEASGTVEHVGLRVTQLRDGNGVLWFIRNGEVVRIGNHSQDWARALVDVPIAYNESVDAASELLKETAWTLWDDEQFKYVVLDEPEIWGVEVLSKEAIVIRLAVNTAPLEQWGVARELRARIKEAFDRRGIQIPYQLQTVWMRTGEPAPAGNGGSPDRHATSTSAGTRGD